MNPSTAIDSAQPTLGFENLARFGPQATKREGSSVRSGTVLGRNAELSAEEQQQIQALKQTDRKVRDHERAHLSVGADLVRSGPNYTYEVGPDNQRYAVSGEVSIDASPARTPEETIPKAQHIRAAALAPADPSPQDRSVAATASRMEGEARIELAIQQRAEAKSAEQNSALFYRGIDRGEGDGGNGKLGRRVDLYA